MTKKKKKFSEIARKKRLQNIQEIHEKIQKDEDVSTYTRLSKVAYILWQYPNTRNSDRTHAIQYYKTFHPENVENDQISFKSLYLLPKMYDLQRDRATIQNTEQLFPPKITTIKKRIEKELEYKTYYLNGNSSTYETDYYLYLDESGKNDKYFVLGGILLNSLKIKDDFKTKIEQIKNNLNSKYNVNIDEWKFNSITTRNKDYYFELLEELKKENINILFTSVILENNGLGQRSKKNKSKEVLKLVLHDCLSIITEYICRSSYANVTSALNVVLDNDGAGIDILEQESTKTEMQEIIDREYKYLSVIEDISWQDSTDNIFIQLSDLYVGALNNIFSDISVTSENAKAKKDFAHKLLEFVGICEVSDVYDKNKNIEFINKCIKQ